MLFKDKHIPQIRAYEKTVTRRVWKDSYNRPREGSIHQAAATSMIPDDAEYSSPMFIPKEHCTCWIRIGEVYKEPLGDMTDEDAQEEGEYETVDEFRESWIEINGEWHPTQVVDVVPLLYLGTGTLYVRPHGTGGIDAYHMDGDCPRLSGVDANERMPWEVFHDWNPCLFCTVPDGAPAPVEQDHSYQKSLTDAAEKVGK